MAFAPPSTADLCGEAGQLNWLRFSPQLSLCKLHYPVPNRTRISPVVTTALRKILFAIFAFCAGVESAHDVVAVVFLGPF